MINTGLNHNYDTRYSEIDDGGKEYDVPPLCGFHVYLVLDDNNTIRETVEQTVQ